MENLNFDCIYGRNELNLLKKIETQFIPNFEEFFLPKPISNVFEHSYITCDIVKVGIFDPTYIFIDSSCKHPNLPSLCRGINCFVGAVSLQFWSVQPSCSVQA